MAGSTWRHPGNVVQALGFGDMPSLELWVLESGKGLGGQPWVQSGNNGVPYKTVFINT